MSYFGLPYIHAVFDVAAWTASMTVFWFTTRHLLPAEALPANRVPHPGAYAIAAGAGALCGAMFFGTANALLSGVHALGFSMVGGIAGAIAAIEAFKRFTGVTGSTGIVFAAPFAATVAVGRIGCFFSGLDDFTYGTPTALPWGVDFGDGIHRHPVQLYESLAMAAMSRCADPALHRARPLLHRQRLLSPGRLVCAAALRLGIPQALCNASSGRSTSSMLVCLALLLYAGVMIRSRPVPRRRA